MKNIVFFGDSFTSGENNNFCSFVDKLSADGAGITKIGTSGTTIGEYSIYPVDGHGLLTKLYSNVEKIKEADVIVLEYGINDATAVVAENVTHRQVVISMIKAFDFIFQTNPDCEVLWLSLSEDLKVVERYGKLQVDYLCEDYLRDYIDGSETFRREIKKQWMNEYEQLIKEISFKCKVIPIMTSDILDNHLDSDCLHPDDKGYQAIAEKLSLFL